MNSANGTIHWCKVWYGDLGDDVCSQLAIWPHEQMSFEMCYSQAGIPLYYYSKDGTITSMTFISSTSLSHPVRMHTTNNNAGGWPTYTLNAYLNNRIFNALPDQWKQLIKQVRVSSSSGGENPSKVQSYCNIFVPSLYELCVNNGGDIYKSEAENSQYISHFTTQQDRICYDSNGVGVKYWTRSPTMGYSNNKYIYSISSTGEATPVTSLDNSNEVYVDL
jgi:hypothetical protein